MASIAILFAVSLANAGDSTSFNPTAITVKVDDSGTPIGTVAIWYKSTPPKGWLPCDGRSTSGYPKLQRLMSNTPNFDDYFLRSNGGRSIGSTQGDAIRNIVGNVGTVGEYSSVGGPFKHTGRGAIINNGGGAYPDWNVNFDVSRVVPTASENRPKNIAVMYIIRAK